MDSTGRNIQRVVRLSPDESRLVDSAASQLGLTPASYLRHLGTSRKLPKTGKIDRDAQREIWKQVSGMARNLNQITIRANSLQLQPGELKELSGGINRLLEQIKELSGECC